jgi:hypothetical protein
MTVYYVNLRQTATGSGGAVTDAAGDSYSLGEAYPSGRQINGWDFGFTASVTSTANDKPYYTSQPHFAGFIGFNGQQFRIGGLTAGSYNIHTSNTKIDGSAATIGFKIYDSDGTTVLATEVSGSVGVDQYMDSNGVVWGTGPAAWTAGETPKLVTITGTNLYLGPGTNGTFMSTIGIEFVPPAVTAKGSTFMMMGV